MPECDRSADDWLIVVAASAGGVMALQAIVAGLPGGLPAAVVILQHRTPQHPSMLWHILARQTRLPVADAVAGETLRPGTIYVARPDLHLMIGAQRQFADVNGTRIRGVRASANPLMETAADVYTDRTIAVVLTGSGFDATDGVQAVRRAGGIVIAQDPASAAFRSMPASAIGTGAVDHVLPLDAIAPALVVLTRGEALPKSTATAAIENPSTNACTAQVLDCRDPRVMRGGRLRSSICRRIPDTLMFQRRDLPCGVRKSAAVTRGE